MPDEISPGTKSVHGADQLAKADASLDDRAQTMRNSACVAESVTRDSWCDASQQVSWWSVHEFVSAVLDQVNGWPMAGTPAWCSLAHDDPQKWAALLDNAQHHALRVETCQAARANASHDVSGAADWSAVSRRIRQGAPSAYIRRSP
jgi:hypothetical protein